MESHWSKDVLLYDRGEMQKGDIGTPLWKTAPKTETCKALCTHTLVDPKEPIRTAAGKKNEWESRRQTRAPNE